MRDALDALKMPSLVKTTGSRGLHVYVPIVRGPVQKDAWTFAKALAVELAARNPHSDDVRVPGRQTSERARARRLQPERLGKNAGLDLFGPSAPERASVSTPVTWREIEKGVDIEDFRLDNVRARIAKVRRSLEALLQKRGRVDLRKLLAG